MPLFFVSLIVTINSVEKIIKIRSPLALKKYRIIMIACFFLFFLALNRGANNTWSLSELFLVGKNTTTLEKKIRTDISYRLNAITKPNAQIAVAGAGTIPYFTHGNFIDELGKNDKVIARGSAHNGCLKYSSLYEKYTSFYPGHEKWDYPYLFQKYRPDIFAEFYQR